MITHVESSSLRSFAWKRSSRIYPDRHTFNLHRTYFLSSFYLNLGFGCLLSIFQFLKQNLEIIFERTFLHTFVCNYLHISFIGQAYIFGKDNDVLPGPRE